MESPSTRSHPASSLPTSTASCSIRAAARNSFCAHRWRDLGPWTRSPARPYTLPRRRAASSLGRSSPSMVATSPAVSTNERARKPAMKITAARLIICSPDRNFVTLKIDTDEGIYGLGDATLNGRELAVASYLSEHVLPCLIGRDPSQIEDIWQYLYRGVYWRRGPVTMSAIAAVDMALWDIKGKALNTPVYNLLGGRSRDGVLFFGHPQGADVDEACEDVARHKEMGYKAIRVQSGIPGLDATYGVPKGG